MKSAPVDKKLVWTLAIIMIIATAIVSYLMLTVIKDTQRRSGEQNSVSSLSK